MVWVDASVTRILAHHKGRWIIKFFELFLQFGSNIADYTVKQVFSILFVRFLFQEATLSKGLVIKRTLLQVVAQQFHAAFLLMEL